MSYDAGVSYESAASYDSGAVVGSSDCGCNGGGEIMTNDYSGYSEPTPAGDVIYEGASEGAVMGGGVVEGAVIEGNVVPADSTPVDAPAVPEAPATGSEG